MQNILWITYKLIYLDCCFMLEFISFHFCKYFIFTCLSYVYIASINKIQIPTSKSSLRLSMMYKYKSGLDLDLSLLKSPQKESIHFCRAEYSKPTETRQKLGCVPHLPLSWSNLANPHFEIQRNGYIPTFGISKWGLVPFGPTHCWMWRTPYFSFSLPVCWVLFFAECAYFLSVSTVVLFSYKYMYPGVQSNPKQRGTVWLWIFPKWQ